MITLLIIIHVIACVILIALVLIQRGRGAGLVESFAGVESMFGTKTSAFLTRTTTIMSIVFFMTCLLLALLSVRQNRSLMAEAAATKAQARQESKPSVNPQETTSPPKAQEAATSNPQAVKAEPKEQAVAGQQGNSKDNKQEPAKTE